MSSPMRILADTFVGSAVGGRYLVDRVLGCGGMGFVLAATHQFTGGRVALKIVPNVEGVSFDRLLLEAKAPAIVKHPNLVEVHDVGYDEVKNSYFLVQELLDGVDLRTYLEARGRLSWHEAVSLLTPVMDALTAAHEAGIVHRDLKPENLFLSNEHGGVIVPRVLDFGIARVTNQKSRLTTVGGTLGTPHYLSPSSARGEMDVGPEGDVWSMGVILFECISGTMPFDGDNYNAIMNAIVSTTAPRLDTVVKDVPPAIVDVIAKSLQHDRSRRYSTMGEMMHALLDAARSVSEKPSQTPHTQSTITQSTILPPPMPHRVDWKPAGVIVATFVVVLSALFGVRALATSRTPAVMHALPVSGFPAHAISVQAAHVPVTPLTLAVPVHSTVALQHAQPTAQPARRRSTQQQRRTTTVTTRSLAPRNGAPVFEP